ncbi:MAG TPA: SWIM zinc finger family protein [Gemmatimonadales bacterium]
MSDVTMWARQGRGPAAVRGPAIDFEAAGGIDLERLERSLLLEGERVGDGRYRVTGGDQDHWVDLYTTSHPRCDCGDHLWRERICKHILAALLREGNERVVRALGMLALAYRRKAA